MKFRSKISFLLAVILLFSAMSAGCGKKSETGKKKNNSSESLSLQSDVSSDSTDSSQDSESSESSTSGQSSDASSENESGSLINSTATAASTGSSHNGSSAAENNSSDEIVDLYKSVIAETGKTAGSSAIRTVNVKTALPVFNNFMSFGANIAAGIMTDEGKSATGMNDVYFEIEKKRYLSAKPQFCRFLFPIDYMVTNTEQNPNRTDWQNNSDYINYKNGVYSFNNDRMNACYKYLDLLKSCGSKVYINFGWGNAKRIWSWYSLRNDTPHNCAPRDTQLFANACVSLMKELYRRGYGNVIGVAFYNEPNGVGFSTIGDKNAYLVSVIKKVDAGLTKAGIRNKTAIFGSECSNIRLNNHSTLDYLKEKVSALIGGYTSHNYYSTVKQENAGVTEICDYSFNYKLGSFLNKAYKAPSYFTEFNTGNYDYKPDVTGTATELSEGSSWTWNNSNASYFISCANSGVSGACRWSYSGQFWTDPFGYGSFKNNYQSLYLCPLSLDTVENGVLDKYYEDSLLTNYVKAGSDVLMTDWTGTDTRVSAFRLPDGNYTVIAEVNEGKTDRNINICFDKAVGKTFYKMSFSHNVQNTANATVRKCEKVFSNVGKTLSDKVDKGYAYYVYTTCAPIKQVELNRVTATCNAGETVQLSASLVDCAKSDSVNWSVSAAFGGHSGTVSQNGVYTAAQNALPGDMVAVKAALKSNPLVYAVAVIEIK